MLEPLGHATHAEPFHAGVPPDTLHLQAETLVVSPVLPVPEPGGHDDTHVDPAVIGVGEQLVPLAQLGVQPLTLWLLPARGELGTAATLVPLHGHAVQLDSVP